MMSEQERQNIVEQVLQEVRTEEERLELVKKEEQGIMTRIKQVMCYCPEFYPETKHIPNDWRNFFMDHKKMSLILRVMECRARKNPKDGCKYIINGGDCVLNEGKDWLLDGMDYRKMTEDEIVKDWIAIREMANREY